VVIKFVPAGKRADKMRELGLENFVRATAKDAKETPGFFRKFL